MSFYQFAETIPNHGPHCQMPEISFHPDGSKFAVSCLESNEIKIYCSRTRDQLRVLNKAEAQLDQPHGLLMTQNHLIVANRHRRDRPATLTVYRLDDSSQAPTFSFETPISNLREGHSMALRGDILVITHCENVHSAGAILAYRFNDDNGEINGPIDHLERTFDQLGYSKGIAFTADQRQLLVTFNTETLPGLRRQLIFKIFKAKNILQQRGLRGLAHKILHRNPAHDTPEAMHNGIAVFDVDKDGTLSKQPVHIMLRKKFCRLENIATCGNMVAITDTVNNEVQLYDYSRDPELVHPLQTVTGHFNVPHAVTFCPNGKLMLVSNFGLNMHDQQIHWESHAYPRSDNIVVFEASRDQPDAPLRH